MFLVELTLTTPTKLRVSLKTLLLSIKIDFFYFLNCKNTHIAVKKYFMLAKPLQEASSSDSNARFT